MAVLVPEVGASRAYPGRKVVRLYNGGEQVGFISFEDGAMRLTLTVFDEVPRPKDLARLVRSHGGGTPSLIITIPE